jgi:hypothetical protein
VRRRREHDAVREARDALLLVGAAVPIVAVVAALLGTGAGDYLTWERWPTGSVVVAALLLGTLAAALLLADRAGSRFLRARPYPVNRLTLIGGSLAAGALLVAGLPTTWPVVIGFAIVCLLLGAVILVGAVFDL